MDTIRARISALVLALRQRANIMAQKACALKPIERHDLVVRAMLSPTLLLLIIVLIIKGGPTYPQQIITPINAETPIEDSTDDFGDVPDDSLMSTLPTITPFATSTNMPTATSSPTFTSTPDLVDSTGLLSNLYFQTLGEPDMRPSSEWSMSEDGVKYVSFWEGYVGSLYNDGGGEAGNCTIGYGHLLHLGPCNGTETPSSISQAQALELLRHELDNCGNYVDKYVKVPISQQQYNILSGLVCGWGYEPFSKSKLLAKLNQSDYVGAATELKETAVYGIGIGLCPGLVRRRGVESSMFLFSPGMPMWPFDEHNMPEY